MKNKNFAELLADNLNRNVILDDVWRKSLVSRALNFAIIAHGNQTRKGDGQPYIVHPIRVALIAAKAIRNDYVIAGALLHDTVEDTEVSIEQIEKEFDYTVKRIVDDLTEKDKSLPWRERKLQAAEHIKEMDEWSLIVKTADKIDNLRSLYFAILENGIKVMDKFNASLKEKIEIDEVMYEELVKAFNNSELLKENTLITELKEALEDIKKAETRHNQIINK